MKITDVRFARLRVPLITPFKTALRAVDHIDDLVVMLETDEGEVGYGAAPSTPVITGDSHGAMLSTIDQLIGPLLIGRDIEGLNELTTLVQGAVVHNNSAKAAVEIALYDLWGKRYQAPLYQLLGGGEPTLRTDVTISVDHVDKMLKDCQRALQQGFDILKIKIGKDIEADIERVKLIDQFVAGRAELRLDVNQGWTAKQTVYAATQLERADVKLELIEQPVKAADMAGMRYVCERITTPVMADESAFGPRQVIELLETGAADIINIKLMKTGGISRAIRIADIAATYQVPCMMGCMLEGSIGVAAAAHLSCAKAAVITKIDLDGPALGQFNPVKGGATFSGANISLANRPGLGIDSIDNLQPITDGVWHP